MKKHILREIVVIFILSFAVNASAWIGMPTPKLHVDGRYLKDSHDNTVNLHGVAITPSPWFNGQGSRWTDYNVSGCLSYNNSVMDALTDTTKGWYLSYIRLHIDPYWTNTPGVSTTGENDISAFNYARLYCPNLKSDSYWVKIDDQPFVYVNGLATSVWTWKKLKSYNLKAGKHTFAIANGEVGAKLDKIVISNFDIAPSGMGDPAIRICNPIVHQVPGKIEAELFAVQNGIQTENTGDVGSGLDVGGIDANDWMEYTIDVATDTIYNATFRCSSAGSGGAVSILLDDVQVGSISFTGTGNMQTFQSFSKDLRLKAGRHTLKLLATTGGFNINWFLFEKKTLSGIKDINESGLSVFPNPTNGVLNIESGAFQFNRIEIVDCTGKSVYLKNVDSSKRITFNPCLQKGIYILRISNNSQTKNFKIVSIK